jgi:hypothetical protein
MIETSQAYHLHKAKDISHLNNQLPELVQIAMATLSDSQFSNLQIVVIKQKLRENNKLLGKVLVVEIDSCADDAMSCVHMELAR